MNPPSTLGASRALATLVATACLAACSSAEPTTGAVDASSADVANDASAADVVDASPKDVAVDAPASDARADVATVDTFVVDAPDVARTASWHAVPDDSTANLRGVWSDATGAVWIVGESTGRDGAIGTVLHGDARGVTSVTVPDEPSCRTNRCDLSHVWGRDEGEVWIVGGGPNSGLSDRTMVLRRNGDAWTFQGAPHATYDGWRTGIYGPGGEVWIAGLYGSIARTHGREWTATSVTVAGLDRGVGGANPYFRGQIAGLWPVDSGEVWAVGGSEGGDRAYVTRWDGRAWRLEDTGSTPALEAIWGASESDLWSVGLRGAIVHWDGRAWTAVTSGTARALHAVWGSAATDVWAVGDEGTVLHWDGRAWSAVNLGVTRSLYDVWGRDANDVWIVGDGGTVRHLSPEG